MYHGRCELRGLKPGRIVVQPGIRVEGGLKGFLGSLRHDKKTGPSTPFHAHNSAAGREGGGMLNKKGINHYAG